MGRGIGGQERSVVAGERMEAKQAFGEELSRGNRGCNENWEAFGEQGPCGCAQKCLLWPREGDGVRHSDGKGRW